MKPLPHELSQGQSGPQYSQHALPKVEPPSHERGVDGRERPQFSTVLTWNLALATTAGDRMRNAEVLFFLGKKPSEWLLWGEGDLCSWKQKPGVEFLP